MRFEITLNMKRAFIVFLPVFLIACASQLYKEPVDGPVARVRFTTNIDAPTVVYTYADAACTADEQEWMRLKNGLLLNSSPKRLGLPLWNHHDNAAKEVYVSTKVTRSYLITGTSRYYTKEIACGVAFRPDFAPGKDYEVAYIWAPERCDVHVYELEKSGASARRIEIVSFDNRVSKENSECLTQFKKRRLY